MILRIAYRVSRFIESIIDDFSVNRKVYALCRSALAFSLLMTIIVNGDLLFIEDTIVNDRIEPYFKPISIYALLGVDNIFMGNIIVVSILLFVISGYFPFISGILHYWAALSFHYSGSMLEGGDQVHLVLTLLLIPLTITDNSFNHWRFKSRKRNYYSHYINYVFTKCIQIQVAVIYFGAFYHKTITPRWADGSAMYYILNDELFGANNLIIGVLNDVLLTNGFVIAVTYGVLIVEAFLFICLFIKNTYIRNLGLILGIMLHLGIMFMMGLTSFSINMICALYLYFRLEKRTKDETKSKLFG